MELARHVSPDGTLTLLVVREIDPDGTPTIIVGFEESPWHIHFDHDQEGFDLAADLIVDRMLIVIVEGENYPDIRLAYSIEDEVDFLPNGEKPELRFWSGRRVTFDQLIDGDVTYKPL